jgi:hypothetical protein
LEQEVLPFNRYEEFRVDSVALFSVLEILAPEFMKNFDDLMAARWVVHILLP